MEDSYQGKTDAVFARFKSSTIMLAFGLAILALLVAIDHREWFHLRPASGTAVAMSKAATRTVPDATTSTTAAPR